MRAARDWKHGELREARATRATRRVARGSAHSIPSSLNSSGANADCQ